MVIIKSRLVSVVFIALIMSACIDSGSDTAWLQGTWKLTYNPQQDDEDDLVFPDTENVEIHSRNGRVVHGKYRIEGGSLKLMLNISNRIIETSFAISADRSRLVFANDAYYTKSDADEIK